MKYRDSHESYLMSLIFSSVFIPSMLQLRIVWLERKNKGHSKLI